MLLSCLLALCACAPPASEGDFDSDNPAAKLYAIERAGRERDRATIPDLVEQLESDDPAIRMMAIGALERITGTRLDYNPYATDAQRAPAVERWVAAVRRGDFGTPVPTTQP